jgi:hypothetical protein
MEKGILQLLFWLFVSPWVSLLIAYTFCAFALHLHGSARSRFEQKLIWLAPIGWGLNTLWAFVAMRIYGPIRVDLLLSIPTLVLITAIGAVALIRASRTSNTRA